MRRRRPPVPDFIVNCSINDWDTGCVFSVSHHLLSEHSWWYLSLFLDVSSKHPPASNISIGVGVIARRIA